MTRRVIFHIIKEMTTMTLEQHITIERDIEELRRELNDAVTIGERRTIEAELAALRSELQENAEEELP
jgi:regulator of replication initiation timing